MSENSDIDQFSLQNVMNKKTSTIDSIIKVSKDFIDKLFPYILEFLVL